MKRMIIVCIILTVIIGSAVGSLLWLGSYTDQVAEQLESISQTAEEDRQKALEDLENLQKDWHQKEHWIGVFVHEDPLEVMSDRLDESISLLRQGLYDEFQVRIRQTIFTIRNIYHQEVPNIENIL